MNEDDKIFGLQGFHYVLERAKKSRIAFGSGLPRFPAEKHLFSKHARSYYKYPEKYRTEDTFINDVSKKSFKKSWFPVKEPKNPVSTPGPGTYLFPEEKVKYGMAFTGRRTVPTRLKTPGPGHYKIEIHKCRQMPFEHSFGGRARLKPPVKIKCGPFNDDLCERCKSLPNGDYYSIKTGTFQKSEIETTFLCRQCYNKEKNKYQKLSKRHLIDLQKKRDCSEFHNHEGCEAKIYLIPPKDIRRLLCKEAYFSLYYN